MILSLVVLFTLLGSICSVGFADLLLLLKGERLYLVTGGMVPYAIGALLGAAFFGMIPHALRQTAVRGRRVMSERGFRHVYGPVWNEISP